MFEFDPVATLAAVEAPILALATSDDEVGSRAAALRAASAVREAAGHRPIEAFAFPGVGHNLMRYRPDVVTAAILALRDPSGD
jgi:pimeloyl-ACP methyl ester carboxylesterase